MISLNKTNMTSYYELHIAIDNVDKYLIISDIIGIESNSHPSLIWDVTVAREDESEYFPFIDYFLSILDGKYDKLKEIGIERNDISIWFIYYYDAQCNMEFSPKDMYNIGKEGITLCISCYDIHDYDSDECNGAGQ
jgi:hypothetical protein